MRSARLAWPGVALTITFVDDLVAGPILAAAGALLGGYTGIALGVGVFTSLVGLLVASALAASRTLDPGVQARIDRAVGRAAKRRFVGGFVHRVGDQHPWATAAIAVALSPVLAVLLARLIHPDQSLVRSTLVAAVAYGTVFSSFYAGLGIGAVTVV